MNFARILDEWDKRSPDKANSYRKDEEAPLDRSAERRRLMNKKPDAVIDLHGLTQDEAWDSLDIFFNLSRSRGYEKILIIHGKGNHSQSEGVLVELSRKFIERCPFAGSSGSNPRAQGGSGATWVLLKT